MLQESIKSPAKLNLYLHITGKDRFGYHLLDTLVCFLPDLHDVLTIREITNKNHIFETTGIWASLVTNNILASVLELLNPILDSRKFHIQLKKNIPVGAGLGGGSSNAYFLLHFLITKYQLNISKTNRLELCSKLGADVSLFEHKTALYAMGIGNVITPLLSFPKNIYALIVYPNKCLTTKDVFQNYNANYEEYVLHNYNLDIKTLLNILNNTKNALYLSSLDFIPELATILGDLTNLKGCLLARMSGSGSVSFGLFASIKEIAEAELKFKNQHPNFFITKSRIQ